MSLDPPCVLHSDRVEPDSSVQYQWRWVTLELTWVSPDSRASHPAFPLPVAVLNSEVCGCKHMLSLAAVWHLSLGFASAAA
eukprot:5048694-Pyramimonas_sp.AAC.1